MIERSIDRRHRENSNLLPYNSLLSQIESAEPPVEERPTAIERLILKSAMKSFGEKGYAGTTLRSIAADAQVTAPMVSYYFKSKEGLFQRLAEIVMESLESEVRNRLADATSFFDAIQAVARAHVDLAARSPSAVEFLFSLLYGPREGQPSPDIEKMYANTRAMIATVFDNGIGSGEFQPRAGMTVAFLCEQLVTLLRDHVSRSLRIARTSAPQAELDGRCRASCEEWPPELTLRHFFCGAGDVPALEKSVTG